MDLRNWRVVRPYQRLVVPSSSMSSRAATAGIGQVLALTDLDNVRSQAVAARLGMSDEGTTDRWFGLTARQFRKTLAAGNGGDQPG